MSKSSGRQHREAHCPGSTAHDRTDWILRFSLVREINRQHDHISIAGQLDALDYLRAIQGKCVAV
jgi:hypothetical protein